MVSKITVMAIVAIVAVPILLGYGMNFETVQETRYEPDKDPVNVTQLISSGTEYTYVSSNTYELNTRMFYSTGVPTNVPIPGVYPKYVKSTTAESSLKLKFASGTYAANWTGFDIVAPLNYYQLSFIPNDAERPLATSVALQILDANNTIMANIPDVSYLTVDKSAKRLQAFHYTGSGTVVSTLIEGSGFDRMVRFNYLAESTGTGGTWEYYRVFEGEPGVNIDLMGGFRTPNKDTFLWGSSSDYYKNILLTLDLNSMADGSTFFLDSMAITKDLANNSVTVRSIYGSATPVELYYDYATALNNTYQIEFTDTGATLYYVGPWPNVAGKATAYHTYNVDFAVPADGYYQLRFYGINSTDYTQGTNPTSASTRAIMIPSPIARFDGAQTRGYQIPVIDGATYAPGDFKSNPGTVISKIEQVGTSITFGGNTYAANTDGTITVSGKNIPLEGMLFSSFFNGTGYDNEINGIVISTSASPATLTFTGKWSASVSTDSYSENTYSVNKWVPGKFAWQGIDTNFKLVGAMAAVGAFIALGIYARRTGARIGGVLIVCAAAGLMFLVMI